MSTTDVQSMGEAPAALAAPPLGVSASIPPKLFKPVTTPTSASALLELVGIHGTERAADTFQGTVSLAISCHILLTSLTGFGSFKREDLTRPPSLFVGKNSAEGWPSQPLAIPRPTAATCSAAAHTMPVLHEFNASLPKAPAGSSLPVAHCSTSYHSDVPAGTSYDVCLCKLTQQQLSPSTCCQHRATTHLACIMGMMMLCDFRRPTNHHPACHVACRPRSMRARSPSAARSLQVLFPNPPRPARL